MNKKVFSAIATAVLAIVGCTYDDTDLISRVDSLETEIKGLKEKVDGVNSEISGLRTIVNALQQNDYVTGVENVTNAEGQVIGYTIHFTKSPAITIYNGKDGINGTNGTNGTNGADGKDGITPAIGVVLEGSTYYWTVNGAALLDASGNKVPASGVAPVVRINNGRWEVSSDNGTTWTDLGSAQTGGSACNAIFAGVKETSEGVVFIFTDGSTLILPREVAFAVVIDNTKTYEIVAGGATEIAYTVNGADDNTVVDAFASGNWSAEAVAESASKGVIKVSVPASDASDKGKVLVFATDGTGKTDIKTISFTKGILEFVASAETVAPAGGEVTVSVTTNVEFTAEVDPSSSSWISIVETKAGATRTETFTVNVDANNTPAKRIGTVNLIDANGYAVQHITIAQESETSFAAPAFECDNFKAYILANFDTDNDGAISAAEAAEVKEINIKDEDYAISSFAGVEAFYNLESFQFSGPSYGAGKSTFETIDLSANRNLTYINVTAKSLKKATLGELKALVKLSMPLCSNLAEIEYTSLPSLNSFICYATALTSVNAAAMPKVDTISVYSSKIASADFSSCPELKTLSIGSENLTSLDISKNDKLEYLSIDNAKIKEMDFSHLVNLTTFSGNYTVLKTIDLSHSPKLVSFNSQYNKSVQLLDFSTAKNLEKASAYSCSSLLEVRYAKGVDNTKFDIPTSFFDWDTFNYIYVKVVFVDDPNEVPVSDFAAGIQDEYVKKLILKNFDANNDGEISETELAAVKELDLSYFGLSSIAGLEAFPIETLNLSNNKLTEFDGSAIKTLKVLDLSNNAISKINLKKNTSLVELNLKNNALAGTLDYQSLPSSLKVINVSDNKQLSFSPYILSNLESLDMSNTGATSLSGTSSLTAVKYLNLAGTGISGELNLGSLSKLETLDISNTGIKTVIITNAAKNGTIKKIIATESPLAAVNVGSGNTLADGVVEGAAGQIIVQDFDNPSYSLKTNEWNYITELTAGTNAEKVNFAINYTMASEGFLVNDGGQASIKVKSGRKVIKFFAVTDSENVTITLERSSGKPVLTKDTDSSNYGPSYATKDENPLTVGVINTISEDGKSFIQDGNTNYHWYNLSGQYKSDNSTVEGEEIFFKVSGGRALIFAINMSGSRNDEE